MPLNADAGATQVLLLSLESCLFRLPMQHSTLIGAPCVRRREAAVQKLFRWLAVSLLAFCILYLVAARLGGKPQQSRPATAAALATERRTLSFAAQRSPEHAGMAASAGRSLLQGWAGGGDATLTTPQKGVRAALFLWVSLINLLAVSTMWAVAADTFSSDAGEPFCVRWHMVLPATMAARFTLRSAAMLNPHLLPALPAETP